MSKENSESVRVIGAGFGRTGTSSFKKAMEILGLGPCYHMQDVIRNGDVKFWDRVADLDPDADVHSVLGAKGYQSTSDIPSARYWREQLARYPDAKVILTTRSPESWYKSCCETIFRMSPGSPHSSWGIGIAMYCGIPAAGMGRMVSKIIGRDFLNENWNKEDVIAAFNKHNNEVISECPKDKLLVFEASQGWEPLCEFLGVEVPDVPYPHVNDMKEFKRITTMLNVFGYSIAIGLVATSVAAVRYAITSK